jgi:heparanase
VPNIVQKEAMQKRKAEKNRFRVLLGTEKAAELPPGYLSLTIDTSLVMGGHWWGRARGISRGVATETVAPVDLRDPRLIERARLLAPAMIRIGGTEADRVGYRIGKKGGKREASVGDPAATAERELVLKKGLWKRINEFASTVGFRVLFVVNAGPGERGNDGAWKDTSARPLIAYTARKGLPVRAWELGNEVNAYPVIHGFRHRVSASRYVQDFARFSRIVRKLHRGAVAVGPASAVIPGIGEPNSIIPALGRSPEMRSSDVMSWHYYPQQSSRGRFANRRASEAMLLDPRHLDSVRKQARRVVKMARGRRVWMTETGHALYGGEPGLSDRYVSTVWWLDQLGLLAREGVSRVFRQSLVGSDYGLMDQDSFEPRPDYYASFLWKKLMGNVAFTEPRVEGQDGKIRAYHHSCAKKPHSHCLLLVSLRNAESLVTVAGSVRRRYVIEPVGGIRSSRLALNGVPVEEDLVFAWGKKSTKRKYRATACTETKIVLPPYACAFVVLRAEKRRD